MQRQQLKFLWKLLHLNDLALQRIVLHSKLDPQYSMGRGGRQRTYKQYIKDAMSNFGVTMEQCMDMDQQDWDLRIEGVGLETAVQQWEARPKASKPIDQEWRTAVSQKQRRKADSPPAEQLDLADGEGADSDGGSDDEVETDSAPEDEFAQLTESQAVTDSRAADEEEDATPWDADARARGDPG